MNDFRISNFGLDIIKAFEGLRLTAYRCAAGVWTIGYGHTKDVKEGDKCTVSQADAFLREDIAGFERDIKILVKVPLNQNQFDALVSFTFNVGSDIDADPIPEGLGDSTLLRKLNEGDYIRATLEFPKWNKAGGKVLPGLVKRRAAEQNLFSKPI